MNVLNLTAPVRIDGKSLFGFDSSVEFYRRPNHRTKWKNGGPFETDASLRHAELHLRRICLRDIYHRIDVIEHLMPLRWTGLEFSFQTHRLPYFPRTQELWDSLEPKTVSLQREVRWFSPSPARTCIKGEEKTGHGRERWIRIERLNSRQYRLELQVTVDYDGIGEHTKDYKLPDTRVLRQIFAARPIALPHWLYYLKQAGVLPGTYLRSNLLWRNEAKSPRDLLEEICDHRALDILGALALATPEGLPAVRYTSHCAGHALDLETLRSIEWDEC